MIHLAHIFKKNAQKALCHSHKRLSSDGTWIQSKMLRVFTRPLTDDSELCRSCLMQASFYFQVGPEDGR